MATVTYVTATSSTSNAASYTSSAFTPVANDLLLVFVLAGATAASPGLTSSVGGQSFTLVTSAVSDTSADLSCLFVANEFSTAVSQTVTFSCTGDNADGCVIVPLRLAGLTHKNLAAIRQFNAASNQTAATTPSISFSVAALTGNPTIGALANLTNPAAVTPPTNWTERYDAGYNTPATGYEIISRDSGFTGTAITWQSTSGTQYSEIIAEINASGANTGSSTGTFSVTGSAEGLNLVPRVGTSNQTLANLTGKNILPKKTELSSLDYVYRGLPFANISSNNITREEVGRGLPIIYVGIQYDGSVPATGTSNQELVTITGSATGTAAPSGNNGTSNQTLATITGTADGTAVNSGSSNQTLATITGTATGTLLAAGTSNQTLATITGTATGSAIATGSSNQTLATITGTATGTFPQLTGTSNQTLATITGTSTGTLLATGTSNQTLATITGTATGTLLATGSSNQTLATITGTATGSIIATGTSDQILATITGSSTGSATNSGTSNQTLEITGVAEGYQVFEVSLRRYTSPARNNILFPSSRTIVKVSGVRDHVYTSAARNLVGISGVRNNVYIAEERTNEFISIDRDTILISPSRNNEYDTPSRIGT